MPFPFAKAPRFFSSPQPAEDLLRMLKHYLFGELRAEPKKTPGVAGYRGAAERPRPLTASNGKPFLPGDLATMTGRF
jgi:hypothetical protein